MADRRSPLSGKEVVNLSSELEKIAKGSSKTLAILQKTMMTGRRLPRQMEKEFKKVHNELIRQTSSQRRELDKLQKSANLHDDTVRLHVKSLKKQYLANLDNISSTRKLITVKKEDERSTSSLSSRISVLTGVTYLFKKAVDFLTKAFTTWLDVQKQWKQAMGELAQSTGATELGFNRMRGSVDRLRGTFRELEGDVVGIQMAKQFVQELETSFRGLNDITPNLTDALLRVGRGFGVGTENAGLLFRTLQHGSAGATTDITNFGAEMLRFADQIGAHAGILTRDFIEARGSVSQFGREGQETFRRAATMANHFGFETRKIFDMMKGFDTFGQASQNVNQLNAMLGTSMSSFELMMEQDPTRRLEAIRGQIMGVGMSWDNMNRIQRMALAQTLGVEEDIAARLFRENITFQDLEREREQAARRQERNAEMQQSNTEMMNRLLERTSTVFFDLDRIFQEFWLIISEGLAPAFETVHDALTGIARDFNRWLRSATQTREFKDQIRQFSRFIKDVFETIKRSVPTWAQLQQKWREMKPTLERLWDGLKNIWSVLKPMLEFAVEHPEVLAALFVGWKLAPILSGLASMASFIGPSGSLLAGSSTLAATLGGMALPAAAIGGAAILGQVAEGNRVSEGSAFRSGDVATRNRLADFAREEAGRRRTQFSMGDTEGAISGTQNRGIRSFAMDLAEGVGSLTGGTVGLSGQEADLTRNSLSSIVRTLALEPGASNSRASQNIRQSLGPELTREAERMMGQSIEQTVSTLRANDAYFSRFTPAAQSSSATETAPATRGTTASPSPTVSPNVGGTSNETINVNVHMDGSQVATAVVNRSISGRTR